MAVHLKGCASSGVFTDSKCLGLVLNKLGSPRVSFAQLPSSASPKNMAMASTSASLSTRNAQLPAKESFFQETVDENGLLCSSRAARELAFLILYAALMSGQKPMRIFDDRLKQRPGNLAKDFVASYQHAHDYGGSILVDDAENARNVEERQEDESNLEAAVLTAPLTQVYNKSVLKLAEEIIQATVDSWREHELLLTDLLPEKWKQAGDGVAAQLSILHLAMSDMANRGVSPKFARSEALKLANRFLDDAATHSISLSLKKFKESAYLQEMQAKWKDFVVWTPKSEWT